MSSRTIEILLVEDNPGDVRLTLEAFKEGRVLNNFTVMSDGVEALAYLRRQGQYANAVQPDLILLDLNLPKKDGREVLAEIKVDERLIELLHHQASRFESISECGSFHRKLLAYVG